MSACRLVFVGKGTAVSKDRSDVCAERLRRPEVPRNNRLGLSSKKRMQMETRTQMMPSTRSVALRDFLGLVFTAWSNSVIGTKGVQKSMHD